MGFRKPSPFFIILVLLMISGCSIQSESTTQWQLAKRTHTIANNDHLKLLWERPIYTLAGDFGNQCTAIEGAVFSVGSETSTGSVSLMAFNARDGKLRWSKETGFYLASSETQLFVSKGQTVTSFSPRNGDVLWSTYIPQARAIGTLSYLDNKLFANATGYPYFVLSPQDGKVIGKYQSPNDFHQEYQNTPFYMDVPYQPIVTNTIYVEHLGRTITTLQAIERKGNRKLWNIDDSISNATSIGNIIFYLSTKDLLRAVNIDSGEAIFETSIQPSIEFFNLDKMVQHDGYYLCADEQKGQLYMVLGDSRQMFAFSIIQ